MPPDRPGDQDSSEPLSEIFWSVARQLRGASQETLAPWDITPAHLRALRTLGHHGAMRLSDLSGRLHIAPRSATEVVDALESRGLVGRRPDPGDRRATLVEMTEHGAEVTEEHPGRTFALVDLLVRASWRRQGIGAELHGLILDGRPEERATLTVLPAAAPAQNAFRTWGWRKVARARSAAGPDAPVADVLVTVLPVKY